MDASLIELKLNFVCYVNSLLFLGQVYALLVFVF